MLSHDEREFARGLRDLGASITVPRAPELRHRTRVSLLSVIAAVAALVIIVVAVAQFYVPRSDTLNPIDATPSATLTPTPTPSHRATPMGGIPSQLLPPPGAVTYTITGRITEFTPQGQRPVDGAHVHVYVTTDRGFYHWMSDVTDATGRYEVWGIQGGSMATLQAATVDQSNRVTSLQPCAYQVNLGSDMEIDIEIVPMSAGGVAAAGAALRGRRPPLARSEITGTVYERRSDGTQVGIANASVMVGGDLEPVIATTLADAEGHYALCGLQTLEHEFFVAAPGLQLAKVIPSSDVDGRYLDFEMRR